MGIRSYALVAGLASVVGACGPTGPADTASARPRGQCFNASSVNSFHALGDNAVIVTVGANRYYKLDIVGVCPNIDWTQRVGLRTTGGSSWICEGNDAEFVVPSSTGTQRCPVTGVHPVSPEEAKAAMAGHP